MNRLGIIFGGLLLCVAVGFTACAGGGSTTASQTGNAMVRFVNGSPDVGGIDVSIGGKVVVTNLAYRSISPYQTVMVGTNPLPQVIFFKTGTQTNIFPTNASNPATFQLGAAPSSQLTIVIEGRAAVVGSAGLNLGAFIEPTITNSSGTYSVVFHHASPSAALASASGLDVGTFTLASPPVYTRFGTMLFSTQTGSQQSFFGLTSQTAIVGPPGIAFFTGPTLVATAAPTTSASASASPSPSPSVSPTPLPYVPNVYAALVPGPVPKNTLYPTNGVDPTDVNQSIPFNNDTVLFIYAIDSTTSASGVELIGTFNN